MRITLATVVGLAFHLSVSAVVSADPVAVDFKALAATGVANARKLDNAPAIWTSQTTLSNGAVIAVTVLSSSGRRVYETAVINGGQRTPISTLITRDGFWYVTDRNGQSKYRPYEAPTDSPIFYIALNRAEPLFIRSADQLEVYQPESIEGSIATLRRPLPKSLAQQLQGAVDQLDALPKQTGQPLSPENQATEKLLKERIEKGDAIRVDLSTGQIVEYGSAQYRTRLIDFQFGAQISEDKFSVANQQWQGVSDDPTGGDTGDLIIIGHNPIGQAGGPAGDMDNRLMNVKTGRFRRIPFPGSDSLTGCFLKDRRFVIVSGLDDNIGAIRPYRIDLKTCKCEALGGPLLESGNTFGEDVSPNGKTLVVTHMDARLGILNAQICLIDLATGETKTLGEPMDTSAPQWTADGQHLLIVIRKTLDMNKPSINSLGIMDMDGKIAELRKGGSPMLMADRKTILFQDTPTQLWQTCDLQGQNLHLYGDGLKGYNFPTAAPDGKRLLMMHFVPGKLPEPIVLPIGESAGTVITSVDGLWGTPAWR